MEGRLCFPVSHETSYSFTKPAIFAYEKASLGWRTACFSVETSDFKMQFLVKCNLGLPWVCNGGFANHNGI